MEFAAHGYTAAVLERVSDRLGLTKGAVYFHFPTKAELACAVGEAWTSMWATEVARSTERGFDLRELESFMVRMTERAQRDDVWAATIRLADDREHIPDEVQRPSEAWLTVIRAALQASEKSGELRRGVDLEAMAWQLTAHVIGMHSLMAALEDSVKRFTRPAVLERRRGSPPERECGPVIASPPRYEVTSGSPAGRSRAAVARQ